MCFGEGGHDGCAALAETLEDLSIRKSIAEKTGENTGAPTPPGGAGLSENQAPSCLRVSQSPEVVSPMSLPQKQGFTASASGAKGCC